MEREVIRANVKKEKLAQERLASLIAKEIDVYLQETMGKTLSVAVKQPVRLKQDQGVVVENQISLEELEKKTEQNLKLTGDVKKTIELGFKAVVGKQQFRLPSLVEVVDTRVQKALVEQARLLKKISEKDVKINLKETRVDTLPIEKRLEIIGREVKGVNKRLDDVTFQKDEFTPKELRTTSPKITVGGGVGIPSRYQGDNGIRVEGGNTLNVNIVGGSMHVEATAEIRGESVIATCLQPIPTTSGQNSSMGLSYNTSMQLVYMTKTIGGSVYGKSLTWGTSENLTSVSVWSLI